MQLLRSHGSAVPGQVVGRGDGKLAKCAAEPHGYNIFLQQLSQPDAEIVAVRDDIRDGVADRDIEHDLRVFLVEACENRLQMIDIGDTRSNDAECP